MTGPLRGGGLNGCAIKEKSSHCLYAEEGGAKGLSGRATKKKALFAASLRPKLSLKRKLKHVLELIIHAFWPWLGWRTARRSTRTSPGSRRSSPAGPTTTTPSRSTGSRCTSGKLSIAFSSIYSLILVVLFFEELQILTLTDLFHKFTALMDDSSVFFLNVNLSVPFCSISLFYSNSFSLFRTFYLSMFVVSCHGIFSKKYICKTKFVGRCVLINYWATTKICEFLCEILRTFLT